MRYKESGRVGSCVPVRPRSAMDKIQRNDNPSRARASVAEGRRTLVTFFLLFVAAAFVLDAQNAR